MWTEGIIIILSYVLGCFNTDYYYVHLLYKKDISRLGTEDPGVYPAGRSSGKKGFVITFLGDALKGALVVVLCRLLHRNDTIILVSILMVVLGHIFPAQLKFKGGKGLSTAFGAFLVLAPLWNVIWIVISLLLLPFLRSYTIASIFALMLLPFVLFVWGYPWSMVSFALLYTLIILFACRNNLKDYLKKRAYHGWHKEDTKD